MRWNDTVTFLSKIRPWQDDDGMWHEGRRYEREVFCNVGIIGTMTMAQLRSSEVRITSGESVPETGLRDMHMIYVRALDYDGEDECIFHGQEMTVIASTQEGENCKMLIRRRLGND